MSSEQGGPYIPAGVAVEDSDGVKLGVVRAAYPHYVAVGEHGEHPAAFRVPVRAIADVTDSLVRLSVPKHVLDPMTAAELAAFGLPEHGGDLEITPPMEEVQVEEAEGMGVTEQRD